jgi:hypothetical protein
MEIKEFKFNGAVVTFETERGNVMVNATEMAKIFGKEPEPFMRNENTIQFVKEALKTENSRYLNIEKESDLFFSIQKVGTFMHRVLALKFAAWLNPAFELWIYATIENLMFGSYKEDDKSLKKIAEIQVDIANKRKDLEQSQLQKDIDNLEKQERDEKRKLDLRKKMRLSNFRSMFTPEEMNGEGNDKDDTKEDNPDTDTDEK